MRLYERQAATDPTNNLDQVCYGSFVSLVSNIVVMDVRGRLIDLARLRALIPQPGISATGPTTG